MLFAQRPKLQSPTNETQAHIAFGVPFIAFVSLHTALFIHNLLVPEAILRGDRAGQRLKAIEVFLDAPNELKRVVLETGMPGDWLLHGLVWLLGGQLLVLLVQLALGAASVMASVGIARSLGASAGVAALAGIFATVLPGSIMNPHVLVTESWFTAAFSTSLWAFAEAVRRDRWGLVLLGMMLMATAAIIRPQAMILPPVALAVVWFVAPGLRRAALASALAAFLIMPGLWLAWRYLQIGNVGLGESNFDLALNLASRANRTLNLAGLDEIAPVAGASFPRLSFGDFFSIATQHPVAFLRTYVSDVLNILLNPGSNNLFGHYLKIVNTPGREQIGYWVQINDRDGLIGFLREILDQGIGLVFSSLVMGILHAVVLSGAVLGAWYLAIHGKHSDRPLLILLLSLVIGFILTIFVAAFVRWTHRSPIEPFVAALAAIGWFSAFARFRQRVTDGSLDRKPSRG